ncbi:LuxR C-terminal-related transcriptional regulator [Kutzneria sp. NPDC052558]|uniref:ATP-binding protein n=1 Tax=Kutzneria sp. NPDC052558 TaxID=3364121 RepID=UPI0037C5AC19
MATIDGRPAGDVVARVRAGVGQVVHIGGPQGNPATSAVAELVAASVESGFHAVRAIASPVETGLRFGVASQILLALGAKPVTEERAAMRAVHARVLPAVRKRPLVIAVDDAQWLDPESGWWLRALARRARTEPLLIVLGSTGARVSVFDDDPAALSIWLGPGAGAVEPVLDGIPDDVLRLLRAIAVADGRLDLDLVRQLAGRDGMPRVALLDAALRTGLVVAGRRGPTAANPAVAEALLESMTGADRADLYTRAAELCYRAGLPEADTAAFALHVPPLRTPWVVRALRQAAADARTRGEHEFAARLLERALAEPVDEVTEVRLLAELGEVQLHTAHELGERRIARALLGAGGDRLARTMLRAADVLSLHHCADDGRAAIARACGRDDLGRAGRDGMVALYWLGESGMPSPPRPGADLVPELPDLPADPAQSGVAAWRRAANGRNLKAVRALATAALEGQAVTDALLAPRICAANALVLTDDVDLAARALDEVVRESRRRAIPVAAASALLSRARLQLSTGRFPAALRDLAVAKHEVRDDRWPPMLQPSVAATEMIIYAVLGRHEDAERVEATPPAPAAERGYGWTLLLFAMGLRRISAGVDVAKGRDYVLEAGRRLLSRQWDNPALLPWRSTAALAGPGNGLIEGELAAAHAWGTNSSIGLAHMNAGMARRDQASMGHLNAAAALLRDSPTDTYYVRALLELATLHADEGDWPEVGSLLEEAGDLSADLGWDIAEQRIAELASRRAAAVLGARLCLSEVEARVAGLAADRVPNAVIARRLSISTRAVEAHLTGVYHKLDIQGRGQLGSVLRKAE